MGEAGEKNSESVKRASGQCNNAWPCAIQPQTAEERGKSKNENADREGQGYFRNAPAELFRKRDTEDAPGIDRAERDLQTHSCDCNYPTIIRLHDLITAALPKCHSWGSRRRSPCRS